MRPRLKPSLRRIDRSSDSLQLGCHPARAVVLDELDPLVRAFVEGLDGLSDAVRSGARLGISAHDVQRLLALLSEQGVVEDAGADPGALRELSLAERDRVAPDLATLALRPQTTDGGFGAFALRRAARISVHGAGRVGAQVINLLSSAGIGHLTVVDQGTTGPHDLAPGGLSWDDVGHPRDERAVLRARREMPAVDARTTHGHPGDGGAKPDLAILCPVEPLDGLLVRGLMADGVPHLLGTAFEGSGLIGPLVLPGVSACLQCVELTHRDQDPLWPHVTARMGGVVPGEAACDIGAAATVAALIAGLALAFVEGRPVDVMNASLDLTPDCVFLRRSWPVHTQCRCFRKDLRSPTMVM